MCMEGVLGNLFSCRTLKVRLPVSKIFVFFMVGVSGRAMAWKHCSRRRAGNKNLKQ